VKGAYAFDDQGDIAAWLAARESADSRGDWGYTQRGHDSSRC
jgi:hypothetical protein